MVPHRHSGLARAGILLAAALALAGPCRAFDVDEPSRTDVQLTAEFTRGRYGEAADTRILTMPLVLRHRSGAFTAQLEVPYVRIESPAQVVPGVGTVGGAMLRESGLGDIWLKLTGELNEFTREGVGIDLTLKFKSHTGRLEKGLGTGANDVAVQLELYKALAGLTAFGHVGWRKTGDVPGYVPYRDPWYGEIGVFGKVGEACQLGGYHDRRQAIGRLGPLSELTVYGACSSGPQRVQLYVTRGFEPASPDLGLGLTYRYRF